MTFNFTAYIETDPESGMYVGTVPNLPGAHTFAESIDDLRKKLSEVIALCLEEMNPDEIAALPIFAGIIDLLKVVRMALTNAASFSGLMLTTETLVTDYKKEDKKEIYGAVV